MGANRTELIALIIDIVGRLALVGNRACSEGEE